MLHSYSYTRFIGDGSYVDVFFTVVFSYQFHYQTLNFTRSERKFNLQNLAVLLQSDQVVG